MKTTYQTGCIKNVLLGSAIALAAFNICAATREWTYNAAREYMGIHTDGSIKLTGEPGNYELRYAIQNPNECLQYALPATVVESGNDVTITIGARMSGCGEYQYRLTNDGQPGGQYKNVDGVWTKSTRENIGLVRIP